MISGRMLRDSFISAANNVSNRRKQIDALNVFPVPDGDTGTNMSMTIGAAKRELEVLADSVPAGEVAQTMASALLWGARGNSGVILSLLFRGFAGKLKGKESLGAAELVGGLEAGVRSAYKAVMKPTEGTILTVARESTQKARQAVEENPGIELSELWDVVVREAAESLRRTPDLLPVLKKAGVVDAGGQGLLAVYDGMGVVFSGGAVLRDAAATDVPETEFPNEKNAAGEYEGEITYTYCTEFIVLKNALAEKNSLSLRAYIESIGDSLVLVEDEDIIKCHVHTDNPGSALQKGLECGSLTRIKIENMREQHASKKRSVQRETQKFPYQAADPERDYGFVAVAAGEGVQSLFRDLGVDNVVSGGQTMNPSTDNILEAIHATPAKHVVVLPNNKNIIMAAEQAVKLADRDVYVLPTKSIPQGLSALLAFDASLPLAENQLNMVKAIERVGTGLVTFAARDSTFDGHKIKKDEILALENGKLAFADKDVNRAAARLVKSLLKKDSTFVTVLYGQDVGAQQAVELEQALCAKWADSVELAFMEGGQPVYYYIISVE